MPNNGGESDRQQAYDRLTREQKLARLEMIVANAPSDTRTWDDQTGGAAMLLADLGFDHGDYLLASVNSDKFLAFVIGRHGVGDEENVLPRAYNAGYAH